MKCSFNFLYRKKQFNKSNVENTKLARVLGVWDITALGISCTIGSGIYVLTGTVINKLAGPAVILSFVIASIATFLSGLSYAELAAKVPRSGSAYIYIYVTIGEFAAFFMGWDLILEYVIGVSAVSNALARYINSLSGNKIESVLKANFPIHVPYLAEFPNFLALGLAIMVTCLLIMGVKESTFVNKIFSCLNMTVIVFIIVCGAIKVNIKNWGATVKSEDNMSNFTSNFTNMTVINPYECLPEKYKCGKGGFLPFGFDGVIAGSAKCFFAFIGFDAIASAGEEVINPKRNIPLSIMITLVVVTVLYSGLSAVLSLMVPYYLLNPVTPFPYAFSYVKLNWASNLISIAAILSLLTCLYGQMFPLPRIIYAMSSDGLLFNVFSKVLPRVKTPYVACLVSGFFAAILTALLDLNELVDMMSIGTLFAYCFVNVCVIVLRHRPPKETINYHTVSLENVIKYSIKPFDECCNVSSFIVNILCCSMTAFVIAFCVLISSLEEKMGEWYIIVIVSVLAALILFCACMIWRQPQNKNIDTFKVPLCPFLQMISMVFNVYLMTSLSATSWVRFAAWFLIGMVVYFGYGIRNSGESARNKDKQYQVFPTSISTDTFIEQTRL